MAMSRFLRCGPWVAALSLAALAQAQPAQPAPDPLDPKAAAPAGVLGQEAVVEAERAVYADLPGTINFK